VVNQKVIERILRRLATGKGIALVVALAILAFFLYKNFDFVTEVTFKVDRGQQNPPTAKSPGEVDAKAKKHLVTPALIVLKRVDIPPGGLELPPYLLAEFRNIGDRVSANVELIIDLGPSRYERAVVRPRDKCSLAEPSLDASQIRVRCNGLLGGESVFVQAVLSLAVLERILIAMGDKTISQITFAEVRRGRWGSDDEWNFFQAASNYLKWFGLALLVLATLLIGWYALRGLNSLLGNLIKRPQQKQPPP
jgi:hypothetical protein